MGGGKHTRKFSVIQNENKFYQDIKIQAMVKNNDQTVSHNFQVSFFESVVYNDIIWYV